jgi:hypothetical protein
MIGFHTSKWWLCIVATQWCCIVVNAPCALHKPSYLLQSCSWAAGEDETEQLLCIMEIMGLPPGYLVDSASRRKVFFDGNGNPTIVPNSRGEEAWSWGVLLLPFVLACVSATSEMAGHDLSVANQQHNKTYHVAADADADRQGAQPRVQVALECAALPGPRLC